MSNAMRIDPTLARQAKLEGEASKRSAPKQIELWAEAGRALLRHVDEKTAQAIIYGLAPLDVVLPASQPVDSATILANLEDARQSGELKASVTGAKFIYDSAPGYPGLLRRTDSDGNSLIGDFINGAFVPKEPKGRERS